MHSLLCNHMFGVGCWDIFSLILYISQHTNKSASYSVTMIPGIDIDSAGSLILSLSPFSQEQQVT